MYPASLCAGVQARGYAVSTSYLKPFQPSNEPRFPSPFAEKSSCKKPRTVENDSNQPWKAVPLTKAEEELALKAACSSMLSVGHGDDNKKPTITK